MLARVLAVLALLASLPRPAIAVRIFYHTQDWLATSVPIQLALARAAIRATILSHRRQPSQRRLGPL